MVNLTWNQFRSKFKGSGFSTTHVSNLWKQYPEKLSDIELNKRISQNFNFKTIFTKKVTIRRVSLIRCDLKTTVKLPKSSKTKKDVTQIEYTQKDLDSKNKLELIEIYKYMGLKGYSSKNIATLKKSIINRRSEKQTAKVVKHKPQSFSSDVIGNILKFIPKEKLPDVVVPSGSGYLETTLINYPFNFEYSRTFDKYKFKKKDFVHLMKNVHIDQKIILLSAAQRGYIDIVKKYINVGMSDNEITRLLFIASLYYKPKLMIFLLKDGRANPSKPDQFDTSGTNNLSLTTASLKGNVEIVKLVLMHKKFNPYLKGTNRAIIYAARKGHLEVVLILLVDGRIDPSYDDNKAIREASTRGYLEIVKVLLSDSRVDPSIYDKIIIKAVVMDNVEIVRFLLQYSINFLMMGQKPTILYFTYKHALKIALRCNFYNIEKLLEHYYLDLIAHI
uniref:Ankyrin repeat protein n=1 Tax=Pithovirus LCPAC001 TaxID=2506585 RepID=A0A481Z1T9_9VIRU|nr:MAG: ankyrin repeat protein [Pithovirus LCPAC001]